MAGSGRWMRMAGDRRGGRLLCGAALALLLAAFGMAPAWAQTQANLSITKTDSSASYTPGSTVTYTIEVAHAGGAGVDGATVSDPLPAGIGNGTWTCTVLAGGALGASCGSPGAGSGAINATVDLPIGARLGFELSLDVPADFSGPLVNTATVSVPAGFVDTDPADNTASDIDAAAPSANVSVTAAASTATARTGSTIAYVLTVANAGPSDADGTILSDTPGPGLDCPAAGATASCSASGGADCPASIAVADLTGAGVVVPGLPPGGQLVVTLACVVTATVP